MALLSGWFIDDVELPIEPDGDERAITRTFQSETLFKFFPSISKSTAHAFDYTITGVIYPREKVAALDEIARAADQNIVIITIPAGEAIHNANKFAVKTFRVSRKGPLFVKVDGKIEAVYPFELTFSNLPDEGEFQETLDGFTDADEGALGTQYLNELIEETGTDLDIENFGPIGMVEHVLGVKPDV